MGAYLTALLMFLCSITLSPLIIYLEKKSHHNFSRLVFIISSVFYIYSTRLGILYSISSEHYYIPAMMISLLLFDPKQKVQIVIGMVLPLIGWLFTVFGPLPDFLPSLMPSNFPAELFRTLNFLGAFLITGLFLIHYGQYLQQLQEKVSSELTRVRKIATLLNESQEKAKLGSWEWVIETNSIVWSEQQYKLFERDPALGIDFNAYLSYLSPSVKEETLRLVDLALKRVSDYSVEHEICLPNGSIKIFHETGTVQFNQQGKPVRMSGTSQDITERKAINEEFAKVKERLAIAVDAINFGIWDWNLKNNNLTWDDNMYRIYDLKKESFSGDYDAFEKTLFPEDSIKLTADLNEVFLVHGDHFESEFRIRGGNGHVKYIKATAKCMYDSDGKIHRIVGANWDNTDKKIAEAALITSAKMASLGEMASGVAHEINNPLTIIQGKAAHIKRLIQNGEFDLDKINDALTKIENTTTRIAKIISGLQSFSRNSVGDPKTSFKVSQIIEESLELCKEKFENLSINLQVDCSIDSSIDCRPSQISQVLMNLISNSMDAISTLADKWVSVEVTNQGDKVRIVVTDSGQGISKEVADKIMQPFFTTKEVGKGTGLGLSISKGIIEEHHGQFTYDASSKNTRFILELPMKQPT